MKKNKRVTLKTKFVLGLILLAIILIVVLGYSVASRYRQSMEAYYAEIAFDEAKIASHTINADTVENYLKTLKTDAYYFEVLDYLTLVKTIVDIKYFYVIVPLEDRHIYIWAADEKDPRASSYLGRTEFYDDAENTLKEYASAQDGHILITNSEEYGYLATAYAPLIDKNGKTVALVGADISMDLINEHINKMLIILILIISAVLFLFIVAYYFVIRKTMILPIEILEKAAQDIADSDVSALSGISVNINTNDELKTLAESFENMAKKLHLNITTLKRVTAEKERIGAELDVATKIQASMLPRIFPAFPERDELDIYAYMSPAKEVGGDFYDFFFINETTLGIVMADVSGKGVPAALFMVISKTLLKNNCQYGKSPKDVFETVNNILCKNNDADMFITAFMGYLDITNGRFTYVNAGHNPPLIKKKDGRYEYMKLLAGFVLSAMPGMKYQEFEMTLEPEEIIFLYTDGLTEAMNPKMELYGESRLIDTANALKTSDPKEICDLIKKDVEIFADNAEQADDISMLALKYIGVDALGSSV